MHRLLLCSILVHCLVVLCHGTDLTTVTGWQSGKSIIECNRYMFDNHLATDVTFQVGPPDGAQSLVRAHKYVLMSRSAVFEAMLFRQQKQLEDQNQTTVVRTTADDLIIRIVDTAPGVFKEMLNFIYTDNVTVTAHTVLPMMYAAKKYQLPKLITECQRVLHANISTDNVCTILDQAIFFNEPELINKTVEFIVKNIDTVLKKDAFLSLSQDALRYIVSNDKLRINETTLYQASLKWADAQRPGGLARVGRATDPVLRETLGDVLYRIRFPTMNLKEFAAIAGNSSVLSCSEKSAIYFYIATGDDNNNTLGFDRKRRQGVGDWAVDRFTSVIQSQWGCNGQPDAIMFTVDRQVTLSAIGSYLPTQLYNIVIDINENQLVYNARRQQQMSSVRVGGTASFGTSQTSGLPADSIFRIPLDQNVTLRAGVSYSIIERFAYGTPCYRAYGYSGITTVSSENGAVFSFTTATSLGTSTTVAQGQIPRLYITG